ncbi:hypothetical protein Aple_007250 [Acrocarpospora pleiomorpha]|uniref:Uncharacterized protein n=1 Tax=Acrocarpospora pleiomorpha TaxID=90975 RepID=A0A5M3X9N8_9ACTN|nr:hypothetical protein [Acrocarpospora pleiomorpha]GES17830.1 hypothetical protein Aple_007250 [Acrocarpospora pleiomorpha]
MHRMRVAVTNTTTTPVYFSELQVLSDSFETMPPKRVDMALTRTLRTDFPIPYGPARCHPTTIPAPKPAVIVARLRVGDEPLREVRYPIPATDPLLARLVKSECAQFILKQAIDVSFGSDWTREGDSLRGVLTVVRKSGEPVTIDDVGATTHFDLKPESGRRKPIAVLSGASLEIPVLVTSSRCDPHAFAEAKQAYLFPLWGTPPGIGETYTMEVVPPKAVQQRFWDYAVDLCDLPS